LRIEGRHVNFPSWRAIAALPQPLANSTARLYRLEQISGRRLKEGDGFNEVRFSRAIRTNEYV